VTGWCRALCQKCDLVCSVLCLENCCRGDVRGEEGMSGVSWGWEGRGSDGVRSVGRVE
jgi:hypothetical protein